MSLTVSHMVGLLKSWSGYENYSKANGETAAQQLIDEFIAKYPDFFLFLFPSNKSGFAMIVSQPLKNIPFSIRLAADKFWNQMETLTLVNWQ